MRSRHGLAILGAALAALAAKSAPGTISLPSELVFYRAWNQLLKEPQPVSMDLWFRCASVTPGDLAEARKERGRHTERYIRVYGNPQASQGLAQGTSAALPYGSILAKEKVPVSPDASADGIGFMIRHAPPEFAKTDGWEFIYAPSSGDPRQTHETCVACHRGAPGGTYIFGSYPLKKREGAAEQ